jgi:hypothetical protein
MQPKRSNATGHPVDISQIGEFLISWKINEKYI